MHDPRSRSLSSLAALLILLGALAAGPAEAHHTTEAVSPPFLSSTRDETSAVWTGSLALSFGGRPATGTVNSNEIVKYNPATNGLALSFSPLPSGRRCTAAVWDPSGQAAYIIGGSDSSGASLTSIVKYVPTSDTVTTPASLPAARNCPAAVWAGGSAYVFGGCCDGLGNNLAGVVKFTPPSTVATLTPTGTPGALQRCCHSAATDGSKVWLFGGSDNGGTTQAGIIEYNIAANSVTVLGSTLPSARMFTAAIWDATSSSAYVFGGFPATNDIVQFTPSSGSVSTISSPFPTARGFMSAAYSGTIAYLFGGNAGGTFLNEIRRYAPNNQAPSAVISLASAIECTSASGANVPLVGTGSSDPDGDPLTYAWTAPGASIANPTAASTTITLPMGSTTVGLTVTDNWEHSGTNGVTTTVADTTAPVTTASPSGTAGPGGWYSGTVSFLLSASDACSASTTTFRSIDGGASTAGTTAVISGDGAHTLAFHSVDSAGNTEATQTLTVRIDSATPSVALTDPAPGVLYLLDAPAPTPPLLTTIVGAKTLRATATDALSGIHHVEFLVDGAVVGTDSSAPYNFFWNNAALLVPGLHIITARAVDQAGNIDEASLQALVVPVP